MVILPDDVAYLKYLNLRKKGINVGNIYLEIINSDFYRDEILPSNQFEYVKIDYVSTKLIEHINIILNEINDRKFNKKYIAKLKRNTYHYVEHSLQFCADLKYNIKKSKIPDTLFPITMCKPDDKIARKLNFIMNDLGYTYIRGFENQLIMKCIDNSNLDDSDNLVLFNKYTWDFDEIMQQNYANINTIKYISMVFYLYSCFTIEFITTISFSRLLYNLVHFSLEYGLIKSNYGNQNLHDVVRVYFALLTN